MITKETFVAELSKLRTRSTFLNLHRYRAESGELADFNIVFHISYLNALKRSVAVLEALVPDSPLQALAKHELLTSYHTSIEKGETIAVEDIDDAYQRFFDSDGKYIKGVKMHIETGNLHLYGFAHQKVVIEPGTYKKVNSKPLTIEKNKLSRLTPVSKFRQFRILPSQVKKITVSHLSLLPPED